jgi:hypothetical protein
LNTHIHFFDTSIGHSFYIQRAAGVTERRVVLYVGFNNRIRVGVPQCETIYRREADIIKARYIPLVLNYVPTTRGQLR